MLELGDFDAEEARDHTFTPDLETPCPGVVFECRTRYTTIHTTPLHRSELESTLTEIHGVLRIG